MELPPTVPSGSAVSSQLNSPDTEALSLCLYAAVFCCFHGLMGKQTICLVLFGLWAACFEAQAKFVRWDLVNVPIGRVLTNLTSRLAANTNDVATIYAVARVYSMAYATNLQFVPVANTNGLSGTEPLTPRFGYPGDAQIPALVYKRTNRVEELQARQNLTNAIHYYRRAKDLVSLDRTNRWLLLPIYLGYAWSIDQSGDQENAKEAYRQALRWAWQIEVEGDSTFKEKVQWAWDHLKAGQNPLKHNKNGYVGPGACYSEEIMTYLIKLLDPIKDAKEIAKLREAQKTLNLMPRAVTPIIVALKNEARFNDLIDRSATIDFDMDGSGIGRRWDWITPDAAFLVYNNSNHGPITSGLQLFGNVTFWIFWENGYQPLSSLDDDGNGILQGLELVNISLWQDLNQNGVSESGELKSAAEYGIVAIHTRANYEEDGVIGNLEGIQLKDNQSLRTFDWIAKTRP
jgi:hypothetical protein